jgi:hypothetical protein
MHPAVSILQLDTDFPRVPGDVGCPQTYCEPVEIIRVPKATVAGIVRGRPEQIDIAPFEDAVRQATGDVVVTSCGFLSYWQDHLAALTSKPFISSALIGLGALRHNYAPNEVMILTFDADRLGIAHLGSNADCVSSVVGLPSQSHLRKVIGENQLELDAQLAADEIIDLVREHQSPAHKHLLLECTNLPPYKAAITAATGLPVTDILTLIATKKPTAVKPEYLPNIGYVLE